MDQYDGSRNGSLAFVQNGGRPPCFPFLISGKGIGNKLCDWFIVLLALPMPINQFTLDCKRRNQKWNRKIFITGWLYLRSTCCSNKGSWQLGPILTWHFTRFVPRKMSKITVSESVTAVRATQTTNSTLYFDRSSWFSAAVCQALLRPFTLGNLYLPTKGCCAIVPLQGHGLTRSAIKNCHLFNSTDKILAN